MISKTHDLIPNASSIFRPLVETSLDNVRLVMISRCPIMLPGHADGLAFSSSKKISMMDDLPITTVNMLIEVMNNSGGRMKEPKNGNLKPWAQQGVLLWNDLPTATGGNLFAHKDMGWEKLSNELYETVYLTNPKAVFVVFEPVRHDALKSLPKDATILRVPGPYPTTSYQGFFGSKIFKTINDTLTKNGQRRVNWNLAA